MKNKKGFKKAVIIFIDILGSQDREDFNEWYNIMRIFSKSVEREKELDAAHPQTAYKREVHIFSDCAYIIYDYKENVEEEIKNMNHLMCIACYNTQKVLYEFLKNGFVARGAITYGDVYYDNERNIWFGPGMNKAYFLETQKAKFPRIIVDPDYSQELMEFNEKNYRNNVLQQEINGEIIKKDIDGLYYLNFFNNLCFLIDADKTVKKIFELCQVEKSKKRKSEQLSASIKEKYDWLEKYLQICLEMDF